ncbi:MAG: hypothetical protein R2834_04220 [Rhodothermales bacterium]
MYKRARYGIGYLAQEASIFSHLSVEATCTRRCWEFRSLDRKARAVRVDSLIEEFGLERVRKSKGYMLSGGEHAGARSRARPGVRSALFAG